MGILNSLTASSKAAYSLRKLLTVYAGSAIRVRESSGDTETDIGFDGSGDLDTTALLAHCGSNDGYIVTWYDQSSSPVNDAIENTTTLQLRIVSSGVIDTKNGVPLVRTVSGTKGVEKTFSSALTQPYTISSVIDITSSAKTWYYGGGTTVLFGHFSTQHEFYAGQDIVNQGIAFDLDYHVYTNLFNSSSSTAYRDGNTIYSSPITVDVGTNTLTGITIGHSNLGAGNTSDIGFGELIIFDSDIGATDRGILEADQDAYYINPPSGITIDHTAGTLNMPVTTHTVTAIASVPINIEHSAGTLNMPSTTHTVTATENINITHIAGTLNFPTTTHTVTAVGEVSIEHSAGTLNLPSNTHTVTATQNVSIAHVTGTLNMPTTTHAVTAGASTSINHVAGTFNMPSVTHTVTIASVVTGLTTDIKSILTRINPTIYRNDKPDTIDNLMVIYQTGGQPALHAMGVQPPSLEKPTFQVLIRNTSHDTAELQAMQVKNILDGLTKLTINNTRYEVIFLEGDIIHLGRDDRERTQFTLNFVAWIKRTIVDTSTWLLNADTQAFTGFNYVWDDTAVWDDNNVWKD